MQGADRTVWEHHGVCRCGRRTYMFGQCLKCIRDEAVDRHEAQLEEVAALQEPGRGRAVLLASASEWLALAEVRGQGGRKRLRGVTVGVSTAPVSRGALLHLVPASETELPFRWIGLVAGKTVWEVQGCVRESLETAVSWKVEP